MKSIYHHLRYYNFKIGEEQKYISLLFLQLQMIFVSAINPYVATQWFLLQSGKETHEIEKFDISLSKSVIFFVIFNIKK